MSAATVLKAARAAGIRIELDGDDLLLEADAAPPAEVFDSLAHYKAGLVALLRRARDGWSAEDWLAYFDERAGIAEFDGGLPREKADALAFDCCVAEWLDRNPVRSPSSHCIYCGCVDAHDQLLPFGTERGGHAWLHSRCWPAWSSARLTEAIAALALKGILSQAATE